MFDIGFSELLVIGVVALVVIGPERLPKVARTMGHLFGRMQRYVAQVKADINREMEMSELSKVKSEFETAARDFRQEVETKVRETEHEINEVQATIDQQLSESGGSAESRSDSGSQAVSVQPTAEQANSPQLELAIDEPPQPPRADR